MQTYMYIGCLITFRIHIRLTELLRIIKLQQFWQIKTRRRIRRERRCSCKQRKKKSSRSSYRGYLKRRRIGPFIWFITNITKLVKFNYKVRWGATLRRMFQSSNLFGSQLKQHLCHQKLCRRKNQEIWDRKCQTGMRKMRMTM